MADHNTMEKSTDTPAQSANPSGERPVVLAAVQDSPVAFDLEASIAKLQKLTAEAATKARKLAQDDEGTSLQAVPIVVVFPEAFLSCYPRGYDFGAKVGSRTEEGRAWFRRYHASSVPVCNVEGPQMRAIRKAASDNAVTIVVGVIERCDEEASGPSPASYGSTNPGGHGTLYCTSLTISPTGELLSAHRKVMPTGSERLVWGQGDGAGVRVVQTPAAKCGVAICWENYMSLYRTALYAQGVEIYAAPTADNRTSWAAAMSFIAMEGRCFVVSCCQFNRRSDYPDDYPGLSGFQKDDVISRGGSLIAGPLGETLAGPLHDSAGILTAKVDISQLVSARMDFDATGHYSRPDIFSLHVDRRSKPATTFSPLQ